MTLMHAHPPGGDPATRHPHPRAGLSLLEVLISCGVLVVGLASVAALLPASSARLAEAVLEDRGGALAANAYADIVNRGLVTADIFANPAQPAVFGSVLPTAGIAGVTPADPATLASFVDSSRAFLLEDELRFNPSASGSVPLNTFRRVDNADVCREFNEAVCYGAMLAPTAPPATRGGQAVLSVAIFRRTGTARQFSLTAQAGSYQLSATDADLVRLYFRPCASVLSLPAAGTPRWLRVASSWRSNASGTTQAFVTFTDASATGVTTVIGFDGLLRVNEYSVTLK